MYCRIFSMRFFSCKSFNAITKEIREILSNFRAHNKHYHRFLIRIVFRMKILFNARMNNFKPENSNTLCTFFYNYILRLETKKFVYNSFGKNQSEPFSVYRLPFVACWNNAFNFLFQFYTADLSWKFSINFNKNTKRIRKK